MLDRVAVELAAACAWEAFAASAPSLDWTTPGVLRIATTGLTSTRHTHIGVSLKDAQRSGTAHANALLRAARAYAHSATHEAKRLLVAAEGRPASLAEYSDAMFAMRRAATAVGSVEELPGRLDALHALLSQSQRRVPKEDLEYVSTIRGWAGTLRTALTHLETARAVKLDDYAAEAMAASDGLVARVVAAGREAIHRGVLTPTANAEAVAMVARDLAECAEHYHTVEVPQVSEWLDAAKCPRHYAEKLAVSAEVASELRACASAWEALAAFRAHREGLLTTPLMKLQPAGAGHLEAELGAFEARCAAIHATWQSTPRPGNGAAEGACANAVQAQLASELSEWRAALPLVSQLLHPRLRMAHWQRVFATVPPPRLEDLDLDDHRLFDDMGVSVDEEAIRKRMAEEMARRRAPTNMCLEVLWEHGLETFAETIATVFEHALARAASPDPGNSPTR